MGFLKGCAKLVGSVVLGATGTASAVLKGVSDTLGVEVGSELFGAAKDASFNGIRNMWDSEGAQSNINRVQNASDSLEGGVRNKMADTAYKMAMTAKRNGDMEKYETYMAKYEEYK